MKIALAKLLNKPSAYSGGFFCAIIYLANKDNHYAKQ